MSLQATIILSLFFCVLGAALGRADDIIKAVRLAGRPPSYLAGEWHTYHYTRSADAAPFVRYEKWSVSRTWTGAYQVVTADPERPRLIYSGVLRPEGQDLLLVLRQDDDSETVFVRLRRPLGDARERIYGFWMGVDFRYHEYCSVVLMCNEAIGDLVTVQALLTGHADLTAMPSAVVLGVDATPAPANHLPV